MAVVDDRNGRQSIVELKIITTRVCPNIQTNEVDGITFKKDALVVPCGERTALEVCDMSFASSNLDRLLSMKCILYDIVEK